ncbi:MAG: hypothetical protein LBT47_00575, partial [Deltaproteobacteria bacterium]|nr:hypothetical protein [Deltaproteobacteria bacterium]
LSVVPHGSPLVFGYSSYCQVWSGHFTALDNAHAGHTQKAPSGRKGSKGLFMSNERPEGRLIWAAARKNSKAPN